MTWHVEPKMMEAYTRGFPQGAHIFSIEAHLMSCESCRSLLAASADGDRLQLLWTRIEEVVRRPIPGPVERLLLGLGISDHKARLLAATRSLSLSWFLAIAVALTFAVAAAHAGDKGYVLFLFMAPLLPLAGVAAAYGPGVDPTYEIGVACPMRSFDLLLIRAGAVLLATVLLGTVAALALPGLNWVAVAWLLPSLGLVVACLALTTLLGPFPAASMVALAWGTLTAIAVLFSPAPAELRSLFGGSIQQLFLSVTLISGLALVARRETFEQGGR